MRPPAKNFKAMKTTHWIILTILAVLLSSCCHPKEKAKLQFTKAQKQLFPPYQQDSIYSFVDQQGNTVDLQVTQRNKWWNQEDAWDDGYCPADYIRYESEIIELNSTSNDFSIQFQMSFYVSWETDPWLTWHKDYCLLDIKTNIVYHSWKESVDAGFKISNKGAYLVDSTSFYENIELNNHVYQNVVEMVQTIRNNIPVQLFYNKEYGIIQIKVDNESYLTLKR